MIHFAGYPMRIGRYCRQRCGWCGEVLEDWDLSLTMVPAKADGTPGDGPMPWQGGALVEVTGGNPTMKSVVVHEDGTDLPPGTCADAITYPKPRLVQ